MAKVKLSLEEALKVSAEARALLGAAIGPLDQNKAKSILSAALDALASHVS